MFSQQAVEAEQDGSTVLDRAAGPGREGGTGSSDGLIDICGGRDGDLANDLTVVGAGHGNILGRVGRGRDEVDKLVVDPIAKAGLVWCEHVVVYVS